MGEKNKTISFHVREFALPDVSQGITGVSFLLSGSISPEDLRAMRPPIVDGRKGIVLSGGGPIWLYGFLIHHFHAHPWVATYERRKGSAIIVESHVSEVSPGDVFQLPDEILFFFENVKSVSFFENDPSD